MTDQVNVATPGLQYSITITDIKGNVIAAPKFQAPPTWVSDNPAAATITASADGTTAVLAPVGPAGLVTNVNMSCIVVNPDGSTVTLTATDAVTTIAGPAANATITGTVIPAAPAPGAAAATITGTPIPAAS